MKKRCNIKEFKRMYIMHREVYVFSIIDYLHLATVQFVDEDKKFYIDLHSLTEHPQYINTISFGSINA